MKKYYLLGLISGIAVSGVVAVNASQNQNTFESCAQLLPVGHKFELKVDGVIDTTLTKRSFEGSFELSDGTTDENPTVAKAVKPFVDCISVLLK